MKKEEIKAVICSPPESNEFRFHGTLEEFKNYMPELYAKMIKTDSPPLNEPEPK